MLPSFSGYQLNTNAFIKLPFDLYKVNVYGDVLSFDKIDDKKSDRDKKDFVNTKLINKSNVMKEIKVFIEDDHFKYGTENLKLIYEK